MPVVFHGPPAQRSRSRGGRVMPSACGEVFAQGQGQGSALHFWGDHHGAGVCAVVGEPKKQKGRALDADTSQTLPAQPGGREPHPRLMPRGERGLGFDVLGADGVR